MTRATQDVLREYAQYSVDELRAKLEQWRMPRLKQTLEDIVNFARLQDPKAQPLSTVGNLTSVIHVDSYRKSLAHLIEVCTTKGSFYSKE